MRVRRSLRAHILMWLGGYALLLTAAVMLHGFLVNEIAERLVWDSLLKTELEHHLQRRADDPRYRWSDTDDLQRMAAALGIDLPIGSPSGNMVICLGAGDITKWAAGLADAIAQRRLSA